MKIRFFKSMLLVMLLALNLMPVRVEAAGSFQLHPHPHPHKQGWSPSMGQLKKDYRKLWIDHTIWTRNYIISTLAGLEDQDQVLARLLKNQQDIGDAIKPYYGDAAGNQLADLLKEHILIAGKIVGAVKSGNQAEEAAYTKAGYKNADDLARFLNKANPNWTYKQLKDLLGTHLQRVAEDVTARSKKDWMADIEAFDKGEEHLIELADVLSEGIIKQFPKQFK